MYIETKVNRINVVAVKHDNEYMVSLVTALAVLNITFENFLLFSGKESITEFSYNETTIDLIGVSALQATSELKLLSKGDSFMKLMTAMGETPLTLSQEIEEMEAKIDAAMHSIFA